MKIEKLSTNSEGEYDKLSQLYGSLFCTTEWTKMFGASVQRYGIYKKGGELIGGFIIYKENKFGFSIYRNPPFTPEIGPILKIEAQNPVSIMNLWKKAVGLIADFFENLPYAIVSLSLNKNIVDVQPFIWKKFKAIADYTYLLDLDRPIEEIWNRMSSERRNDINKGKKDGLQIRNVLDYELIKPLVLKTFSRQKLGISEFYLNKILFSFANDNNSFAYATFNGNQPLSGAFCIYDSHTAYYLLGGYDETSKHHGAGALSLWESIKHAKRLGLKYFDFEGSMIPSIEKFFRGFGGRLTPNYRINKARLPIEIVLKFFKRELF